MNVCIQSAYASKFWWSIATTLCWEVPSFGSVDIKRSKAVCFVTWRHFLVAPSQILCLYNLDRAGRGGLTKTRRGTWIHYTWRPPTTINNQQSSSSVHSVRASGIRMTCIGTI